MWMKPRGIFNGIRVAIFQRDDMHLLRGIKVWLVSDKTLSDAL